MNRKEMIKVQSKWDSLISTNYHGGSTIVSVYQFGDWLSSIGLISDHAHAHRILEFAEENKLKRFPKVVSDVGKDGWLFFYQKLPTAVWLARAIPSSVDLFNGMKSYEIYITLQGLKAKKLRPTGRLSATSKTAQRERMRGKDGSFRINFRERDKRTNWNTVK